ncbi:MAG TPA: sulfotransferase domain-containing protein [Methylobacter sp.]|jgi:hypothetical protein
MVSFLTKFHRFFIRYPEFLIIGVQKAGTTTLFDMLNSYPNFCGSFDKEPGFFTNDVFYNQGNDWYLKQFERCNRGTIKFEATPFYIYHPDAAKRIFSFNKRMKFIVILREPAARCYSAWNMYRQFNLSGADNIFEQFVQYGNPSNKNAISDLLFAAQYPSFKQAVEDDIERYRSRSTDIEPSFVRRGIYYDQIENYLQYFSLDNFLFLEQRELSQPIELIRNISEFLKVAIDVSLVDNHISSNVGDYLDESAEIEKTLLLLRDFYREHNEKLFSLIGIHYDWNEKAEMK